MFRDRLIKAYVQVIDRVQPYRPLTLTVMSILYNAIAFLFMRETDYLGPARGNRVEQGVARCYIAGKYNGNSRRA